MRCRLRRAAIVAVGLLLAGAALATDLEPVLRPALDDFEPAVAELLNSRLDRLDGLISSGAPDPVLGQEFGELGKLFLVYNLPESAASCLSNAVRLRPDEFSWRYLLGAVRERRGDLEAARADLEAARALSPGDPAVRLRLARIEFELGREQAAEELYSGLVEMEGFVAAARYGLGRIAAARGHLEAAIGHFEAALAEQPEASQVRYRLGLAYRDLGERARAEELLVARGAGQLRFPDPEIESLGDGALGVEVYLADGRRLRNRGDLPGAVAAFQQAVAAEPNEPEHWRVLGATLLEMGRLDDAVRAYREVMRLAPEDPGMLYNLAIALLRLGQPEEAEEHLRTLVRLAPDHVDARVNLASLLERTGREPEAERLLTEAIALDPYDASLRVHRASVLTAIGRALEARRELTDLLRVDPDNVDALIVLGVANEALGSPGDAVARWEEVLERGAPDEVRARALFLIGRSHLQSGRAGAAVARLRAAVELLPAHHQLRLTLASALGASGDYEGAVEQFDGALSSAPRDEGAHFGKAMSLLLWGREQQARRHLESSLELLPESVPLEHLLARVLATASDDSVREGAEALRRAQRVFERAQTIDHAETVAMALAELGRFQEAVDWQEQVIERARSIGDATSLARLAFRRDLFTRGEPVREPWRGR